MTIYLSYIANFVFLVFWYNIYFNKRISLVLYVREYYVSVNEYFQCFWMLYDLFLVINFDNIFNA